MIDSRQADVNDIRGIVSFIVTHTYTHTYKQTNAHTVIVHTCYIKSI
jgi:hypothetical protein